MIIIPEIETVLILVPRTASGSLKKAVLARYPKAMAIYRHMEADGVPAGYDRWPKIGVVREPVARLWSVFKFCKAHTCGGEFPEYAQRQARAVDRDFSDWIVQNEIVFTDPYDCRGGLNYYPQYNVLHSVPETRKSQFVTLRPDLGTEVVPFETLSPLAERLGVLDYSFRENETEKVNIPPLTREAADHVRRFFAWDIEQSYLSYRLQEAA